MKLERTFSRGASTISSQDGSGTWRPPSGIARIQGTASRLVSAASQQRTLSVTASPPRLDSQVLKLFFTRDSFLNKFSKTKALFKKVQEYKHYMQNII